MAMCKFHCSNTGESWDLRLTNIPRVGDNVIVTGQDGSEPEYKVETVIIMLARDKQDKVIHTYNDQTMVYVKKL